MNLRSCNVLVSTIFFAVFVLGTSFQSYSQQDTLGVKTFDHNDLDGDKFDKSLETMSGNRLAENPDDLAQEIIIIEGDEIRKFGYSTLVDVLKSIPGFRTSQPGNAMEGETFLMRGLYGNDHTKILINGIPIKPEAVKGMPIAAQLPIRHAERIEIVLGPSSSTYGSDAMAGVINIVLPEIDRPVFAWADVNLLTPKTSDINLTLGGKTGRGKHIVNYELFASSRRAQDLNLVIPDDSIRIILGPNGTLNEFEQQLFFAEHEDHSLPEIEELNRESRLIGGYIKYRAFELSAINMFRIEHSGLGTNPLNASYHNPGTTFGENINSFSLKFNGKTNKRLQTNLALSALMYRTLENSSYWGVKNFLSNGMNFMYARSLDLRGEYQGTFKMNEQMKFVFGATGTYSLSHPFTNYLERPFRQSGDDYSFTLAPQDTTLYTGAYANPIADSVSNIDSTQFIEVFSTYNVGTFLHYLYKSKSGKLNIELGSRIDFNGNKEVVFTPKVGVVYNPWEHIRIVGYYGRGHRAPRSYHIYNNYFTDASNFLSGGGVQRDRANLNSEELHGAEARVIWDISDNWRVSGRYFMHYMENRIMRQVFTPDGLPPPPPPGQAGPRLGVGFFNSESYSFLGSGLFTVEYNKQISNNIELDVLLSYEYARGWEYVEPDDDAPDSLIRLSDYRFVPRHSFKGNVNLSFYDFTLSIRNNVFGLYVNEITQFDNQILSSYTEQMFHNMDIVLHVDLLRQLGLFVGVYNVFESVQSGVPNVNVTDSWTYNPQYGRTFKFGLNFQLN